MDGHGAVLLSVEGLVWPPYAIAARVVAEVSGCPHLHTATPQTEHRQATDNSHGFTPSSAQGACPTMERCPAEPFAASRPRVITDGMARRCASQTVGRSNSTDGARRSSTARTIDGVGAVGCWACRRRGTRRPSASREGRAGASGRTSAGSTSSRRPPTPRTGHGRDCGSRPNWPTPGRWRRGRESARSVRHRG